MGGAQPQVSWLEGAGSGRCVSFDRSWRQRASSKPLTRSWFGRCSYGAPGDKIDDVMHLMLQATSWDNKDPEVQVRWMSRLASLLLLLLVG